MSTFKPDCPNGHGNMPLIKTTRTVRYRGMDITYEKECHRCPECGLEASTTEQAAVTQKNILNMLEKKKDAPAYGLPSVKNAYA